MLQGMEGNDLHDLSAGVGNELERDSRITETVSGMALLGAIPFPARQGKSTGSHRTQICLRV